MIIPPRRCNSSWLPNSTSCPLEKTKMTCVWRIVDRRCATAMVVRLLLWSARSKASCTNRSDSVSRAGVASSSKRILGFRMRAYRNMRRLFWTIYSFDRNVSLLMGRASCLQDIEIDTSHQELSADPSARPWDKPFIMGIKMARHQGQIYSRLYSTAALAGDPAERAQHIRELATELH